MTRPSRRTILQASAGTDEEDAAGPGHCEQVMDPVPRMVGSAGRPRPGVPATSRTPLALAAQVVRTPA